MNYLDANREAFRRVVSRPHDGVTYVPAICPIPCESGQQEDRRYIIVGHVPAYIVGMIFTEQEAVTTLLSEVVA